MHLEKATTHSSEAGLAGWISSNDVTLFTVVLVVVIAIFLQANLTRGSKENEELTDANTSLADVNRRVQSELSQTRQELATATRDLNQTRHELEETLAQLKIKTAELNTAKQELARLEASRKEVESKLAAADSNIASLRAALDKLNLDKTNLLAREAQLSQEKGTLTKEKDDLSKTKAQLDANLAELAAKLQQRLKDVADLQKERDLLDQKSKVLAERVQKLESQLGDKEKSMVELKKSTDTEAESLKALLARALERQKSDQTTSQQQLKAAVAKAQEADAQAQQATTQANDYYDRLRRAAVYFKDLDAKKQHLQLQVEALKTQLANALDDLKIAQDEAAKRVSRDKTINRELVGLTGKLNRVAILFDSSGSMNQDGRWDEVQRIANTWLEHLQVDECVLIVFSSSVTAFPTDGRLIRVSGPEGPANRQQLRQYLRSVKPEGWTNTLAAMHLAYRYPNLDTIILFSDGAPTDVNSGRFSPQAAQRIYALCQEHSNIPVNAIGLGNYFDKDLSTFLRTVSQLTGGTFLGR
jgi:chromosome segregation ATPase